MNNSSFSQRLKQALEDADMKAAELCRVCDLQKSTVSQYLSGKYVAKHDRITVMARALGCSPDWLAGKDVPVSPSLSDDAATGFVPILLPDASNLLDADATVDYEPAEERYCDGHHFVIIADDDSMDPVIFRGDRVLCLRQDKLSDGQTGVFLLGSGQAVIRELRCTPSGSSLISANRYYPPCLIDNPKDLRIIGKVVKSTRYW